jgi:hypothetical protein
MPFETIVILGLVTLAFATFAAGLFWADHQTREFRE